jgi:flagellar protein FliS
MSASLRARYVTDAVQTTSPQRLVTMLYDRLVSDLLKGEVGFRPGGDATAGRHALGHALDILTELRASLDVSVWDGAVGLARLYAFLMTEVIGGDLAADAERIAACRTLVEPLRDAWHEAAAHLASEPGAAAS